MPFEQTLLRRPEYAQAWYNKGFALSELRRKEEALLAFEEALRLTPDDVDTWYYKGLALHDLQRYEEAVMAYEHVLRLQPNDTQAWSNRELALHKLERDERKRKLNDDERALLRAIVWCEYTSMDGFLEGIFSGNVELPYVEIRMLRDLGKQSRQMDPLMFKILLDLAHKISEDIDKRRAHLKQSMSIDPVDFLKIQQEVRNVSNG